LRFLAELKRRNVIRMAGLYLVGAWLAVQVAATLLPVFEAPAWLMKVLVAVLAFGFLAALVFSWVYELTPAGLRRDDELTPSPTPYQGTERRLRRISDRPAVQPGELQPTYSRQRLQDRLIIGLLLLAVGYFLLDKFVLSSSPAVPMNAATPAAIDTPAQTAPQSTNDLIAVLPFRNRSALPEDAYFAEGMHDDLLTQLSKVAGLKVISRTSMMRYAGTKLSVPEIARELGAAVILEGAVQRSGDQVLVTVQLIDADSDVHLWAERYDRALTTDTVFAIQAEIAQAVADATRVALSPAEAKALATGSTDNLLAYEAFLQGKLLAANDLATPERFAAALVQFERAITLDPTFAEAHARKARIQLASYWFGYADASMREAAKLTTAQAVALAPDDIETWMAQAYFHYWGELDYASADALLQRVIERAPGHAEAWYARGLVGRRDGRFEDTIAAFRESLKIDPANTDTLLELSNTLLTLGVYDESDELRARVKALGVDVPSHAAETALNRGDIEGAWAAIDGPNDFYATLPFRIALASRNPDWIARALSTELWPERLRQFPEHPDTHALAEAEALLVLGQHDAAQASLRTIKARIDARETPYPAGWSSTSYYFYYPSDLPGMLGDLEGVRAAERDWIANAPRDVWAESGIRLAFAVAYARAGDAERALDHLERTQSQVGPVSFISFAQNPGLDTLRQHPRYLALAAAHEQWKQQRQATAPL
jgi:TolB-like protein/Tfp pilus assembly protein PilF